MLFMFMSTLFHDQESKLMYIVYGSDLQKLYNYLISRIRTKNIIMEIEMKQAGKKILEEKQNIGILQL